MRAYTNKVPTHKIDIVGTYKTEKKRRVLVQNCSSINQALNLITHLQTFSNCKNCKIKKTKL